MNVDWNECIIMAGTLEIGIDKLCLYLQDLRSFVNVTHVVIFGVLGSRQRSTQAPSSAKS